MLPTLTRYLQTLENPDGLCRRLAGFELCRDSDARPVFFVGNSAAVFKIRLRDRYLRLKCYTRPVTTDLEAVYGKRFLPGELFVFADSRQGGWTDVVVDAWIEGVPLDRIVREAAERGDRKTLRRLSARFDALAAAMLAEDCAHGDLKPENILVDKRGKLRPIDFDAAFQPAMAGRRSPELGTEGYRHPLRTAEDFDARLDDYPAAMISATLAALALDPTLAATCGPTDGMLFDPREILSGRSASYRKALDTLTAAGDALHYRIARLLEWPAVQLPDACTLFALTQKRTEHPPAGQVPELFERGGRWGYRTTDGEPVPPLYDCGFEFTEELAAVRVGRAWHYIDTAGRHRIDASRFEIVKPFRDGTARVRHDGRWSVIDRQGRIVEREL